MGLRIMLGAALVVWLAAIALLMTTVVGNDGWSLSNGMLSEVAVIGGLWFLPVAGALFLGRLLRKQPVVERAPSSLLETPASVGEQQRIEEAPSLPAPEPVEEKQQQLYPEPGRPTKTARSPRRQVQAKAAAGQKAKAKGGPRESLTASAAAGNPRWAQEEYHPFHSSLKERGWDFEADLMIHAMIGIRYGRTRLVSRPSNLWTASGLPSVWPGTRESVSEVLKRLAGLGIHSSKMVPAMNSLIPLFALHHHWGNKRGYRFSRAVHWLLLANRAGRYAGSAITALNHDVRAIAGAADAEAALKNLHESLPDQAELTAAEFLNRYDRTANRFLRLMLCLLLFHRRAKDWLDDSPVGHDASGTPIKSGFEPQWHHIYPKTLLKRHHFSDDEIHALANVTILNDRSSARKLSRKELGRYVKQYGIPRDALRAHFVPESFLENLDSEKHVKTKWHPDRYREFLAERATVLAQSANDFLQGLRHCK